MKIRSLRTSPGAAAYKIEKYRVEQEPYYVSSGEEIELFRSAYENQIPVLLKGPTGCGKTRFMEYMAWMHRWDPPSAIRPVYWPRRKHDFGSL